MLKSNLMMPTGYEQQQKAAESKRRLAKLMLEKGLSPERNMQSWTQVLGHLAETWAGKSMDKKADKMDAEVASQMSKDFAAKVAGFSADRGTLSPEQMVDKYSFDPMMSEQTKPYVEALTARLKNGAEGIVFGDQYRLKSGLKDGEFKANDPNDAVLRGPGNTFVTNNARMTAALGAQGFMDSNGQRPQYSMPDPMAGGQAPTAPGMQAPAGAPPAPTEGGMDLSLLSDDEKQIMSRELQRRAGGGAGVTSYTPPHPNVPLGSPLSAQKPPSGLVNGKPYWLINGVPYDNAEGK